MNRAIQDKHPRNRAKRFRALLQLQNTTVWKVLNENVVAIQIILAVLLLFLKFIIFLAFVSACSHFWQAFIISLMVNV